MCINTLIDSNVFPEPNLILAMGEPDGGLQFGLRVKKTWLNRARYWLLCKFFPFKVKRWDNLKQG